MQDLFSLPPPNPQAGGPKAGFDPEKSQGQEGWGPEGWAPQGGVPKPRKGEGQEGWEPTNIALFSPLPSKIKFHPFVSLSLVSFFCGFVLG